MRRRARARGKHPARALSKTRCRAACSAVRSNGVTTSTVSPVTPSRRAPVESACPTPCDSVSMAAPPAISSPRRRFVAGAAADALLRSSLASSSSRTSRTRSSASTTVSYSTCAHTPRWDRARTHCVARPTSGRDICRSNISGRDWLPAPTMSERACARAERAPVTYEQDIGEALGDHEGHALAAPLQQRIGGHGGALPKAHGLAAGPRTRAQALPTMRMKSMRELSTRWPCASRMRHTSAGHVTTKRARARALGCGTPVSCSRMRRIASVGASA